MGGATASYHFGENIPVLLRLGAGVMAAQLRDERSGSFEARDGSAYDAHPLAHFTSATYFYLDPVLRVGVRFADRWELSGQLQALLLIALAQPRWNNSLETGAASDGVGTYADETLMGSFLAMFAPGISLRTTFGGETPPAVPDGDEPSETARR
jgi:hypothetical protein